MARRGAATKLGSSQGDRASGPPVPFPIGAGWRETDHVPIGGPEKAPFWLGIEHMRASGPATRSALPRRALSPPVLPSRRAPFHLKIRRILGVKRERPAIGPARRSLIPDLAPLEGCPPAAKCAYGSFVANSPPKLGVELAHSRFPSRKWHMFRFQPSEKIAQPASGGHGGASLSPRASAESSQRIAGSCVPSTRRAGSWLLITNFEKNTYLKKIFVDLGYEP